ncbi:tryptophanyl-tRNA synthetase [Actinokineospora alba]|uniref:Tryptophan--tRNA ligase n=1 Tax=Actinokineospora alba TaxID=504798 RepID=A0A1H0RPZ6_9PSEU|nr:tryptophan--tRNA ligase [Actinokineospora alba]TDP66972.1 tryptophanyl-tRNA synthetase [Actinokineospora alba]SDJ32736.1 tryptophanyl-tRNA synthetase [Actinokineospora alba]SDP31497.1 tryptophanyl-tRNA synthetase [Actinokineospora alba]
MTRLSAITPSGHAHIGNHLGAISRWATQGRPGDLYFVSDLHAMTVSYNPARLRVLSRELLAVLVAAGIAPEQVFVQSDLVRELGALSWVLECTCSYGEAARMTQFKQKSEGQGMVRLGLLTYPVLMAADILLQGASEVPVGDDQAQHVELARSLARRFNSTYGELFTVPSAVTPPTAARVRDLADPTRKMSKSTQDTAGSVFILDEPDLIRRKIRRAVTDGLDRVTYSPDDQPGLANLLEILSACTGTPPRDFSFGSYGEVKEAVAEAVIEELRPIRKGAMDLLADQEELDRIRKAGAERAAERGAHRLTSALRLAGVA